MGTIQEKHDEGHFQHKLIYDNYQILIGTVSTEGFIYFTLRDGLIYTYRLNTLLEKKWSKAMSQRKFQKTKRQKPKIVNILK